MRRHNFEALQHSIEVYNPKNLRLNEKLFLRLCPLIPKIMNLKLALNISAEAFSFAVPDIPLQVNKYLIYKEFLFATLGTNYLSLNV
jgi:hypothetical protein